MTFPTDVADHHKQDMRQKCFYIINLIKAKSQELYDKFHAEYETIKAEDSWDFYHILVEEYKKLVDAPDVTGEAATKAVKKAKTAVKTTAAAVVGAVAKAIAKKPAKKVAKKAAKKAAPKKAAKKTAPKKAAKKAATKKAAKKAAPKKAVKKKK